MISTYSDYNTAIPKLEPFTQYSICIYMVTTKYQNLTMKSSNNFGNIQTHTKCSVINRLAVS